MGKKNNLKVYLRNKDHDILIAMMGAFNELSGRFNEFGDVRELNNGEYETQWFNDFDEWEFLSSQINKKLGESK